MACLEFRLHSSTVQQEGQDGRIKDARYTHAGAARQISDIKYQAHFSTSTRPTTQQRTFSPS